MKNDNYKLYQSRKEPHTLSKLKTDSQLATYPSIREIKNEKTIRDLVRELKALGDDYVLISWISPPYGRIVGYGLYLKKEAESLVERSNDKNWGFPKVGRIYSTERLEDILKKSGVIGLHYEVIKN